MKRLTELMSIPEMIEILKYQKSDEQIEIDEITSAFKTAFRNTINNNLITSCNQIHARYAKKMIRPKTHARVISPIQVSDIETKYEKNEDMGIPSIPMPPKVYEKNTKTEIDEIPSDVKKLIGDNKFLKKHYLLMNKINRKVQYKKLYNGKSNKIQRN